MSKGNNVVLEVAANRTTDVIVIGEYTFEARTANIEETFALRRIGSAVNQSKGDGDQVENSIRKALGEMTVILNERVLGTEKMPSAYLLKHANVTFIRRLISFLMLGIVPTLEDKETGEVIEGKD